MPGRSRWSRGLSGRVEILTSVEDAAYGKGPRPTGTSLAGAPQHLAPSLGTRPPPAPGATLINPAYIRDIIRVPFYSNRMMAAKHPTEARGIETAGEETRRSSPPEMLA